MTNITYDPRWNTFRYQGRSLTSVTKFIKQFIPPFERDYWLPKKAKERGITESELEKEWNEKGRLSRKKGNRVHAYAMSKLNPLIKSGDSTLPNESPFLQMNSKIAEEIAFDAALKHMLEFSKPVMVENIVADFGLGVAGLIDSVFQTGDTCHIIDWKTGHSFDYGGFNKMLPPFDGYKDTREVQYSLQVSLYRLLAENDPEFDCPLGDSFLVHLNEVGGFAVVQAIDFRDLLKDALEGWEG